MLLVTEAGSVPIHENEKYAKNALFPNTIL